MADTRLKIPPIRNGLFEVPPQGSNGPAANTGNSGNPDPNALNAAQPSRIAKEWYYFWTALGSQLNQNSQTLTGLVTYGTHANRPAPSTMPDGAFYVEQDRHGVIYQNQMVQGKPAWVYSAGTMWGSISPDQRPTGLGPNDSGFEYRTTDQPPRQFLWSSTGWVEVTAVRYDTHANRLAAAISGLEQGMLWIETDRSNVVYENQGGTWKFVTGTMLGTLSPDQRPTDLGAADAGFFYRGTDQPPQAFTWSGSAWAAVPAQLGDAQYAVASASLTLTTTATLVPGTSITLNRSGRYLITGNFSFAVLGADTAVPLRGYLSVSGAQTGTVVVVDGFNANQYIQATQQWFYTAASSGVVVGLLGSKDSGTGTSIVNTPTTISALWVSP